MARLVFYAGLVQETPAKESGLEFIGPVFFFGQIQQ